MSIFSKITTYISTFLQLVALLAIVMTVALTTPAGPPGARSAVTNFEDAERGDLLYYSDPAALV